MGGNLCVCVYVCGAQARLCMVACMGACMCGFASIICACICTYVFTVFFIAVVIAVNSLTLEILTWCNLIYVYHELKIALLPGNPLIISSLGNAGVIFFSRSRLWRALPLFISSENYSNFALNKGVLLLFVNTHHPPFFFLAVSMRVLALTLIHPGNANVSI